MGKKSNRRNRMLETPSPDRDLSKVQVETSKQGNETSSNVNTVTHETLGGLRLRLTEHKQPN